MSPSTVGFRMTALGVVATCLFGALFARLWYLQVLDSGHYVVAAQHNGVRIISEPAPRGRVLDRLGRPLVDNKIVDELTLDRRAAQSHPDVIDRLAALIGKPRTRLDQALVDPRLTGLAPVPLGQADARTVTYVEEHAEEFPGVDIDHRVVRSYPHGSLAAHLLGYVGEVAPTDLAGQTSGSHRPGDLVGRSGVELAYDTALEGRAGTTRLEVDSHGTVIGVLGRRAPVPGHDVRLSVDLDVQALAEDSLAHGLDVARSHIDGSSGRSYAAPAGAVVVLDPRDGSVLALASAPTFDPSEFVGGISTSAYAALNDPARGAPLTDRATAGLYAPGSTFKLITATAALNSGLVTPLTPFDDVGYVDVGGVRAHNAGGTAYGELDLAQALTVSSDAYFYTLGQRFWAGGRSTGIQDTAALYGFGARTGLDIGGEPAGHIPGPASRPADHARDPSLSSGWYAGDNVNLAVGQGELTVTPLQLANAYATFANGGTLYQPRVALDVEGPDGVRITDFAPRSVRVVRLAASDRKAVLDGLEGVVGDARGTAHDAFAGFPDDSFPVAAKTGTAQVTGRQDTSVFTGFAPAGTPRYEVTVVEEQAGFGASGAAPVARRILEGLDGRPLPAPAYVPSSARSGD